jgi:hypothetical protein
MKLTEAYINIIINWWAELLVNDIHSNLTAANIDNFKYHLNGTLSTIEFEPGEKLKIRVGLHNFLPNDNSLAKAFSVAAQLVGLSPLHLPHGAELEINELYEIITCKNVGEIPKNLPLTNVLPVVKSKSFDAAAYLIKFYADSLNAISINEMMLLSSKKRKLHEPENFSPIGSPIGLPSTHYLSQRQSSTYFAPATNETNLLKQNGFFKYPLITSFDQTDDNNSVKHQKFETDKNPSFRSSV